MLAECQHARRPLPLIASTGTGADMPPLALNPALDPAPWRDRFARDGRALIPDVLAPDVAEWLHASFRNRTDWRQVMNSGNKVMELDRAAQAALTPEQRAALDTACHAGARYGFQYRFETIRVPDEDAARAASDDPLAAFARWWSGGEPRAFLRAVTGEDAIAFADAQGTAYAPGDFLTGHDDAVEGKGRLAAYVLGLTPRWRLEWGGLLLFHGADGAQADAWLPGFNRLALFRVPQPHSVSEVSRAAAFRRYSITGWLRESPGARPGEG